MKMSIEYWWNYTERKAEVLGEKPVPLPVYSPQISHGLAGNEPGVPR